MEQQQMETANDAQNTWWLISNNFCESAYNAAESVGKRQENCPCKTRDLVLISYVLTKVLIILEL